MTNRRYEDWPSRLSVYLRECQKKTFKWGAFDCATFSLGAIKAMTGLEVVGKDMTWTSAAEAGRIMKGDLQETARRIAKEVGFSSVAVLKAQRGDAVLVQFPQDALLALGICVGKTVAVVSAEKGLTFYPMEYAKEAWSIK